MAKHAISIDAQIAESIRKLSRGLYDTPRIDVALGALAPSTDDIANALRDRDGARLQAAGAHAANLLGLSDHVPVRVVFLTDGRSRTVRLGRRQIVRKHTTSKQMATAGRVSGTVVQTPRWLGQRHTSRRIPSPLCVGDSPMRIASDCCRTAGTRQRGLPTSFATSPHHGRLDDGSHGHTGRRTPPRSVRGSGTPPRTERWQRREKFLDLLDAPPALSLPQAGPHLTFKGAGHCDHHSAGTGAGHDWPHESVARGDRWSRSVSHFLAVPAAL